MLILWVGLYYTCTPRGGTGNLRMTGFNNSTEVAPRGPLTPSHKGNTYSHFTLSPQKHPPEPNISESFPWQPQQANTLALTTSAVKIIQVFTVWGTKSRQEQGQVSCHSHSAPSCSSDVLCMFDKTSTLCYRRRLRWQPSPLQQISVCEQ